MKKLLILGMLLFAVFIALVGCDWEQYKDLLFKVRGKVVDSASGSPIVSAEVFVDSTQYSELTNTLGDFEIELSEGTCTLTIVKEGYLDGKVIATVNADNPRAELGSIQLVLDAPEPEPPQTGQLIIDFQSENTTAMVITYKVGLEDEVTLTVEDTYYNYTAEDVPEGTYYSARVQPVPSTGETAITIITNGKVIGGSSDYGEVIRTGEVYFLERTGVSYPAVISFETQGTGMVIMHRGPREDPVTLTLDDTYFTYSTEVEIRDNILGRLLPIPSDAHSSVSIAVNGEVIGASSRPGEVIRNDMYDPH